MFEKEIVPLLNKQKGFVDELLLVTSGNRELVAITLWETKVYADIYNHELYPKVEKMVEKYLEGAPILKDFEEGYSTFHKIAIPVTV